ncbi:uncharacterized protein LOC132697129 [Cylas formicarius]|uniref:uncharacterized protein LOC132697129 n=1 Tax=Cylas formicarius TaxID=197179 RepID=UPI002958D1DC|nr:uncharacterized protein LOC132697129 [Cylas formicarius]
MEPRRKFVACDICKRSYDESVLLQNSDNNFYCKDCFKQKLCSSRKLCDSDDIKKSKDVEKSKREPSKSRKLIPNPDIYIQNVNAATELHRNHSLTSVMSLSKKPLQCPKDECNKYISIGTLEFHFKTEHKDVPVICPNLDARCASKFYLRDIRYCVVQCIALLKIEDFKPDTSGISYNSAQDPKPLMILMCTRIAVVHTEEGNEVERDRECRMTPEQECFGDGDRIIVWVASNVATNLSYTVAVSTIDREIRQKYFGPVLTLNENPKNLCRDGKCLILTHIHCRGMSENGAQPLALDVVIHGPD